MEFDTSINLRKVASYRVDSEKDLESFVRNLWDKGLECARHAAQAGEAEIWLDYSDALRTRHLSVLVEQQEGGYSLSFRSGTKPSRIGDAVMILSILCAFWLGSKVLVPQPPVINIIGTAAMLAIAGAVAIFSSMGFGKSEAEEIMKRL